MIYEQCNGTDDCLEVVRLRAELAAARKLLKRIYACDEKWGPNGWLVDVLEYMKAEAAKEGGG